MQRLIDAIDAITESNLLLQASSALPAGPGESSSPVSGKLRLQSNAF
jgi:hypothetical protein